MTGFGLLRPRCLAPAGRWRAADPGVRQRSWVLIGLGALFWVVIFASFARVIQYFEGVPEFDSVLAERLLAMVLLSFSRPCFGSRSTFDSGKRDWTRVAQGLRDLAEVVSLSLLFAATKCARHRHVALVLAPAVWLAACGGMLRGASSPPGTLPQPAPTSETGGVSGPITAPAAQIPPPTHVATSSAPTAALTASRETRDKQLEILMEAVKALHQEIARNDARSAEFLKENKRLRTQVDSLLHDLARSRERDQRLRKKLQAIKKELREIVESPPLAAVDGSEGAGISSEVVPQARSGATAEGGGAPAGTVRRAKPTHGPGLYHVVTAGETLIRIARAHGVDYRELAKENGIEDPEHIEVGQRIFIPGATGTP
jgi:LysM repeat protein